MRDRIEVSQQRLKELEGEAAQWREQVTRLKPNLEDALTKQFAAWKFTESEEEIARLILKGLSNKEIAGVRASSEKTIKQHTTAIYRKSGLTSRSQIAAFFLEDLF
jgi:DNA-binding NarL/FixJ family response regulator